MAKSPVTNPGMNGNGAYEARYYGKISEVLRIPNLVDLQTNYPSACHSVSQIYAGNVINPRPDSVSFAFDAELVPLTIFERLAGYWV